MGELTTVKPEVDEKSYNLSLSLLLKASKLSPDEIKSQKTMLLEADESQSLSQSLDYISTQTTLRSILEKNFHGPELTSYFDTIKPMLVSLGIIGEYLINIKSNPDFRGTSTPPFTGEGWDISEERETEITSKMEQVREQAKQILNGQTYLINKSELVEHFPELLIEVCRQKVASATQ